MLTPTITDVDRLPLSHTLLQSFEYYICLLQTGFASFGCLCVIVLKACHVVRDLW